MKIALKKPMTMVEAVMKMYHGISKQKAKQILSHSAVFVNSRPSKKHHAMLLNEGDVMELADGNSVNRSRLRPTRKNPIVLQYEDEHLIVAIKPAGILSSRSASEKDLVTFHQLLEEFLSERDREKVRLRIVHRLDREVEGMMLYAKTEEAKIKLQENWKQIGKRYLALLERKPEKESGIVENWLRDNPTMVVEAFDAETEGSKFAKTEYRFLRPEGKYALVEVLLHTGRKNQIRVHMSLLGCPIVGDRKYGADGRVIRQIRLAASQLDFVHPVTGKKISLSYQPATSFFKPSESAGEKYRII